MSHVRWQPSQQKCNGPSTGGANALLVGAAVRDMSGGSRRYGRAT
jgi:hypothetical protein